MSGAETKGFSDGMPGAPIGASIFAGAAAGVGSGAIAIENGEGWKRVVGDSEPPIAGGSGTVMADAAAMEKGDEAVVAAMAPGTKGLVPNGEGGNAPNPGAPCAAGSALLAGSNCASLWGGSGTSRGS
jgi:hypothetical protein